MQRLTFSEACDTAERLLKFCSERVHTERWQGVDISKRPEAEMHEVRYFGFEAQMPVEEIQFYRDSLKPNLPWADDHFQERVCGKPLNPGVQWKNWPYARSANGFRSGDMGPRIDHRDWAYLAGLVDGEGTIYWRKNTDRWQGVIRVYQKDRMICDRLLGVFKVGRVRVNGEGRTTTLPDRTEGVPNECHFWQVNAINEVKWLLENLIPYLVIKKEGALKALDIVSQQEVIVGSPRKRLWDQDWEPQFNHSYMSRYWPQDDNGKPYQGIKYRYGDLNDLVEQLHREPLTRQAYLPIFFPEDTGVANPERKPCTLGYLFLMRNNRLDVTYYIRSCDFVRHFRDDVYMTVRLNLWILDQLRQIDARWLDVKPGLFRMDIGSLHMFRNDYIQMFEVKK